MNKRLLLIVAMAFFVTGCAGKSDRLGLGTDGAFNTYAESYQPARNMLLAGQFDELAEKMKVNASNEAGVALTDEEYKDKLVAEFSELALVERGLMTLNSGNFERALLFFDAAELKLETEEGALAKAGGMVGKGLVAGLFGSEEATDYTLRGYEKVMLYNYKALCYMLLGDRRAYNVTRRAIEKQQEEWELFKTMIEAAKAEEEKKLAESGQAKAEGQLESADTRDEYTKKKAASVPSAYVNPFGDYMNGMIMEIDSIKSAPLRDNARIAYSKVLENNDKCLTAKQAVQQLKQKNAPRGQKMVQILLSDSFSPEKKVETSLYRIDKLGAMVNYAQATPVSSKVATAQALVGGTKVTLSPLSDMEALILRDDEDRAPLRNLLFAAAVLRSGLMSYLGGDDLMALASKAQMPDTRSWLTLPGKVVVARLYVPQGQKQLELQTRDEKGKTINRAKVSLAAKGPTVIYAVSYEDQLKAYANKSSWIVE